MTAFSGPWKIPGLSAAPRHVAPQLLEGARDGVHCGRGSGETHDGFYPHSIRQNRKTLIGHHPAFICSELIRAIKVAGHFVGRRVSRHHGGLTGSGQQVSKQGPILKNLLIYGSSQSAACLLISPPEGGGGGGAGGGGLWAGGVCVVGGGGGGWLSGQKEMERDRKSPAAAAQVSVR